MRSGKHVVPPPTVRHALERIFGRDAGRLEQVRVIEHSLFARLHRRAIATTRRRRIFLRGSASEFFSDPTLMLHEYCHVLRQWEPGSLTTLKYVREWLRHGYWNNCFEVEARAFAREHKGRFSQLLCEGGGQAGPAIKQPGVTGRAPRVNLASDAGDMRGAERQSGG
jgi:Domain of unknown function (DUF4157)